MNAEQEPSDEELADIIAEFNLPVEKEEWKEITEGEFMIDILSAFDYWNNKYVEAGNAIRTLNNLLGRSIEARSLGLKVTHMRNDKDVVAVQVATKKEVGFNTADDKG